MFLMIRLKGKYYLAKGTKEPEARGKAGEGKGNKGLGLWNYFLFSWKRKYPTENKIFFLRKEKA